jgi:hypothetical protein
MNGLSRNLVCASNWDTGWVGPVFFLLDYPRMLGYLCKSPPAKKLKQNVAII